MWFALVVIAVGLVAMSVKTSSDETPSVNPEFFQFDSLFKKYAKLNSIPWEWLKAIALNESDLGRNKLVKQGLVSSDGLSYGLMQMRLSTAKDFLSSATIKDLNNPEISISLAAKYIAQLSKLFPNDERKIIMSYNQGQGNTMKGKEYAAGYYEKFKHNLIKVRRGYE